MAKKTKTKTSREVLVELLKEKSPALFEKEGRGGVIQGKVEELADEILKLK